MHPAFVIARKDLRQRLRDRSAIVVGLIAPIGIAAVMSLAFRGMDTFHFTLGVVNADKGPISAALVDALHQRALAGVVTTKPLESRAQAVADVRTKKVDAALVIPAGFSAAIEWGHPKSLAAVTSVDNGLAGTTTESIVSAFTAQLNADRLSVATALASGTTIDARKLDAMAANLRIPVSTVEKPLGAKELTPISYFAPAIAIFFLLFMVSFTARSFFVDRSQGMIERIRVAPVRPVEILLGKALSVFVYGVASLTVIAAVTTNAFGADWGDPVAAAALCVALTLSVVALTALVIGLARTQRQAEAISSILVFGLALIGGNFVFLGAAPPLMRSLALATPNGWALRGFTDLATLGGGAGSVVTPILAILGFTAVVGTAAILLAPRAVRA
jgi:ABC-2 type transport system permease protein